MSASKLDDRVFRELLAKLGPLRAGAHARVGVLASKGGAAPHAGGALTIVEIAAIHELGDALWHSSGGTEGIPERSFIRGTFDDPQNQEDQRQVLERLAREILTDKLEVRAALDQLGAWGAARVRARIKSHIPPPLKEETIKRKGSSTPLVDTGQLINAVTWEVSER
jgi:hypothetical protein